MSVIQVGLVDTTGALNAELVQSVAAALNIQVTRDLPPVLARQGDRDVPSKSAQSPPLAYGRCNW